MKYDLQYKRYSESAILIEWPSQIDENILQDLLLFRRNIERVYVKEIVEVISAYNSLLIYYNITIEDVYSKIFDLKELYLSINDVLMQKNRLWKIPVCYSLKLAPDLGSFLKAKSLTIDELIVLHTTPLYRVYFLGFLPGFFYLGGLNEKLNLPRKTTPALKVAKGSVAIGGNQTGVYPSDSPGGWHVIGRSPIDFFNLKKGTPCFVEPNDLIQFMSVKESEYNDIRTQIFNDMFSLNPIEL
ncbi:5-oxoprolinase subunit PxpB [Aquimarina sp. AD10]|uniref:5-oxoprolinase subunit PxpB n=1 Tax=Aquimarina sp. AD10 TaxID=1714849 RepID=UPI000E4A5AE5|nr:5-oxoprolinase subunit PxpB [Aquimarina sp. AD10]AXT63557.1 5-oxoprolinase subunit PxpB [Aquimarina sp. AD10]RKM99815.1 5-oxoprolinase subunit PxpB [Aquimarina sp. AD10]